MDDTVRKPAVAGQFYAGNPGSLRAEIERYLDEASVPEIEGRIVALVSPHAGYMYSGRVAAHGYRLIRGSDYESVVVISPSHAEYFDFSSIYPGRAYVTPLGEIPIDRELAESIAGGSEQVRFDTRGHRVSGSGRSEHSLEVQLPFLQMVLGDFKLVPIVMGDQSGSNIESLGAALGRALAGRKALIVASTDLSHFHGDGEARALDHVFTGRLEEFDTDGLIAALGSRSTEACGGGPTAAAMIAARLLGAGRCRILEYANSGDVSGDTSSVVGYVSAAMLDETKDPGCETPVAGSRQESAGKPPEEAGRDDLSRYDKEYLLRLVRSVITADLGGADLERDPPPSPVMDELRGAFVTLKKEGQLRGCIGYIEAIKPLAVTIEEMSRAAAFKDYRFSPVTVDEIDDLEIEISVLSPIREIDDPGLIEVGRHGIIVTRGGHRGLLLPQVAVEWGWDLDTFLDHTCMKAGLPAGAWKESGTKIEIFSADVFSEHELGIR